MIQQILVEQPTTAALILFIAIIVGVFLERGRAALARREYRQRKGWSKGRKWSGSKPQLAVVPKPDPTPADLATEQLKTVMRDKLLEAENVEWRLMAQVSLGEIVASANKDAYLAINSKRVDLLLVDSNGNPLHAIEYQGSGHHQGTAAARDAVKKEALRRAGIGYEEVIEGDRVEDVKAMIAKLIRQAKN
jgi:hypothetical protein